jgi:hypothetical protein
MFIEPLHIRSLSHAEGLIEFLVPGPRKPFAYNYDPGAGAAPESVVFEPRTVTLQDVREAAELTLDANGAAMLRRPTAVNDFYDPAEILRRYYPEAADIIASALGARKVVVFDHNVRRGSNLPDQPGLKKPVQHAHTDFTPRSALTRVRQLFGAESDDLTRRRFAQINLWRPIRGPLRDAPLGICDGATVPKSSLRAADLRYATRTGEIFYLAHSPKQRWYFASDMSRDEIWLIKNSDSLPSARIAPHSAFAPIDVQRDVLPRESIEVRAFAFFDD